MDWGSCTSFVLFNTSTATSNNACWKPIGCVHGRPVACMYASVNSFALCPVGPDLNGYCGVHQISLVNPLPRSPSELITDGNSSALPMVTILGRKPCCAACDQNVAKSGGIILPVTISQPAALKAEICDVKSLFIT